MKKKGELTTQQLVMIIILITSFAIILFLLFRLNFGEISKKEICHNSVLMKSKSLPGTGGLDCTTNYVCISGGGECDGFEEDYKIDIDINSPDAKNQTMKAIADEMADCWWMFGEGKVDYIGLDVKDATLGDVNCVLCSVISFDDNIKSNISYNELYRYLASAKKSNSESYLAYLYGTNDVSKFDFGDKKFIFSKKYSVLTGIGKLGILKKTANWFASGFDAFNAFFSITPKFKDYGYIEVKMKERDEVEKLECGEFLTKS